jgi:hypothetical protein
VRKNYTKNIKRLLGAKGINFLTFKDQVTFEKNEVLNNSGGTVDLFYARQRALSVLNQIRF